MMTAAELRNRLHAKTDAMLATIDRVTEPEDSGCGHEPRQVTILEAGRVTELCYECAVEWCKKIDRRVER